MQLPRSVRLRLKRLAYGGIAGGRDGELVAARLGLRAGMRVADIGSGFGEFSVRFAEAVGSAGIVYAVDTDPDLREAVAKTATRRGLANLRPIAARPDDPALPEPVDLAFFSATFHHMPDPDRYFAALRSMLAAEGRVAILETQPSLLTGWFGHSTPPERVRSTMEGAGYRLIERLDIVRWSPLQLFAVDG